MAAVLVDDAALDPAIAILRPLEPHVFHGSPYDDGRWMFTIARVGYGVRLTLCGPQNTAHAQCILFRDFLRAHPDRARAYETLKTRLAAEAKNDWAAYTGGKTAFIETALREAAARA